MKRRGASLSVTEGTLSDADATSADVQQAIADGLTRQFAITDAAPTGGVDGVNHSAPNDYDGQALADASLAAEQSLGRRNVAALLEAVRTGVFPES